MRLTDGDRIKLHDAHKNLSVLINVFRSTKKVDRKIARGMMRNLEKVRSAVSELELEFHQRLIEESKAEKN
jgi:hypothetical protein